MKNIIDMANILGETMDKNGGNNKMNQTIAPGSISKNLWYFQLLIINFGDKIAQ